MKLQLSGLRVVIAAQAALIVFLGSWLYNEYLHNRFLQDYLTEFWASNMLAVSISLGIVGAVTVGYFLALYRGRGREQMREPQGPIGSSIGLAALDICPFCNIALTNLSDNRFQCRKCRRYFKK